jgi:hypothetical protein
MTIPDISLNTHSFPSIRLSTDGMTYFQKYFRHTVTSVPLNENEVMQDNLETWSLCPLLYIRVYTELSECEFESL